MKDTETTSFILHWCNATAYSEALKQKINKKSELLALQKPAGPVSTIYQRVQPLDWVRGLRDFLSEDIWDNVWQINQ